MSLLDSLSSAKVYDLAQPYFVGMPHYPTHPPFLFSLTKIHGEIMLPNGGSSAADSIALGGHVGTHIDALSHFSCNGKLHGGRDTRDVQSYGGGVNHLSAETIQPIIRRGVLLDIAGLFGVQSLAKDFVITPEHLDAACRRAKVEVRAGDVVLLRTGWARFFEDPAKFIAGVAGPGPEIDAARWLSSRQIFAAGSDTVAFEHVPATDMPVHVHLLVESGIHIIEILNLEEIARDGVHEFVFVGAPLKIRGGTGAPIRPLAVRAAHENRGITQHCGEA
jgi:kynurenine formamidase